MMKTSWWRRMASLLGSRKVCVAMATLLVAVGVAATWASVYAAMNFDVSVSYLFYGAIIAGAMEFVYGLTRFIGG